jgi:hypothetical protein
MNRLKLIALSALLIAGCKNKEADVTDDNRDTVIVHDTVKVEKEKDKVEVPSPKPKPPVPKDDPAPTKKPWEDKMNQYHEVSCKIHKGGATVTDRTDQAELLRDLYKIRDGLSKDDKFHFGADLVRANDMSTCPK